jgi:hypothetical protein
MKTFIEKNAVMISVLAAIMTLCRVHCSYKVYLKGADKLRARVPHTTKSKNVHKKYDRKHLISELQLKEYIYNKCSKCSS